MGKIIVLDDIIFSLQSKGGISRIWRSLSSHLIADEIISINNFNNSWFGELLSKLCRYLPAGLYWTTKRHIFLSSYYRISFHPLARNVVIVHDLIYEKFHKWSLGTWLHLAQRKLAFRFASKIICVSNNTRRDLLEYYRHVDPNNVTVIHNGVDEKFILPVCVPKVRKNNQFLYVGSRGFCKNFQKVIEALRLFPDLKCVCVTPPFSIREKQEYSDVIARIEVISQVDDKLLIKLYSECKFLLMPSMYEGFGLPVIEAFGVGTNVVLPRAHSFIEIAGEHGMFYSPGSVASFIQAIEKAMRAETTGDTLHMHAKYFSWQRVGADYTRELFECLK